MKKKKKKKGEKEVLVVESTLEPVDEAVRKLSKKYHLPLPKHLRQKEEEK